MSALDRLLLDAHAAATTAAGALTDAREELRCATDPVHARAALRFLVTRARRAHARLGAALDAIDTDAVGVAP